jgi:signal peptidase I
MDRTTRLELAMDMLNEVIERDEDIPLKTFGHSMEPFIYGGDWVVVRRADAREIGVGDVVIYQAGSVFVAHRVIRRCERDSRVYLAVKGDAHLAAEGEIAAEAIVARVVALQKAGKKVDLNRLRWRMTNSLIAHWSQWVDRVCRDSVDRPGSATAGSDWPLGRLLSGLSHWVIKMLMGRWATATELGCVVDLI